MTRILVVDDDSGIRQVIAYALEDEGYQVDQAMDGQVALQVIAQRHPDVILLDMTMPGMDGWDFVKQYRARYSRQAPIIVLTAAHDAARRAADVDAESYLAKPFDLDTLLDRVAALTKGADESD